VETPVFNWKYVETKATRVVSSIYREPNQKKKYVAAISEMNQACFFVLVMVFPFPTLNTRSMTKLSHTSWGISSNLYSSQL
jgi:hypothetical protein